MTQHPADEVYASIRGQFRDDFQFAIDPLRDDERQNYDASLKFADSGIKALFGLNGGGLIALPAFSALFKIDMLANNSYVLAAGLVYVVGLICAALTCLLGYWSAMAGKEACSHLRTAMGAKYAKHYKQRPETSAIDDEINLAEKAAAKCITVSVFVREIAVSAAICGLVAFCVAVYIILRAKPWCLTQPMSCRGDWK